MMGPMLSVDGVKPSFTFDFIPLTSLLARVPDNYFVYFFPLKAKNMWECMVNFSPGAWRQAFVSSWCALVKGV